MKTIGNLGKLVIYGNLLQAYRTYSFLNMFLFFLNGRFLGMNIVPVCFFCFPERYCESDSDEPPRWAAY